MLGSIRDYCETTTLHGFYYLVTAPKLLEKILWGAVIVAFSAYVGKILYAAVVDWNENPTATRYDREARYPVL